MASLMEARREREEAVARMAEEDKAASNNENRGGIVPSVEDSAKAFLGAMTRTSDGKMQEASDKAREAKNATMEEAGETTKDTVQEASDKARETKDAAMEKAGEMKDRVKDQMEGTEERASKVKDRSTAKLKDYEGTYEEKRGTGVKYKESAAEAARKAREFLVEAKEEARVKLAGDAKNRLGQTNDSARMQSELVKERAAEKAEEDQRKREEPDEREKGKSAAENIYGAFPSMPESFEEAMTLPEDIVVRKKGEHGGGDNVQHDKSQEEPERKSRDEDDIMMRVKEADQMTGTGFNDPGKMGGEGTGHPKLQGKLEGESMDEDDVMLRVKDADQMTGTAFNDPGKMGGEGTGSTASDHKDKHST
ncbi:Embryonic protein DC-8 [Rhynchospora pubera]|uniref:Embryonic protein DC-8 n=1 Tax=Rhynchospora pubera TaxID=906938 RepID=A0AAV8F9H0_9POAL|nr:Embryonic protein DC-8 [Rhynchospora pubera]